MAANIIVSPSDTRSYKGIVLENKIKCLLISDPDTDKSAVSMNVRVGSFEDPWECQGLAHFLEHMLFLGTSKYPDEAEYRKYISQNSGMSNAFTDKMETNYFFSCKNDALEGALDRFSQFFINPLFTDSCTDREMKAVHSEYEKNILSDVWREHQMYKVTGLAGNSYTKFNIGCLETLNHETIRQELIDFYEKYYSANVMGLVVLAEEDLEKIESWVRSYFSPVLNKEKPQIVYKDIPFDSTNLNTSVKLLPTQNKDKLSISWILPNLRPHYKKSPGNYLSHLFGHEGENSLLSLLIDEGLAYELMAGCHDEMELFSILSITIELTEKGFENYFDVIEYCFQYLEILKKKGVQQWVFEEIKAKSKISFNFSDKEKAENYVVSLSSRLHKYPIEDVVYAPYAIEEFDPELIHQLLNSMTCDNFRLFLSSKKLEPEVNLTEKYFGVRYSLSKIPSELLERLRNSTLKPKKSKKFLDLPPQNIFMPKNFDLIKVPLSRKVPEIILQTEQSDVFFKDDCIFNKPKGILIQRVYVSSEFGFSVVPEVDICFSLWISIFKDSLRETLYLAEMASIVADISQSLPGIDIKIVGFSETIPLLYSVILEKMIKFKPEEHREKFSTHYEKYLKGYENFFKNDPYMMAYQYVPIFLLNGGCYDKKKILEILKTIDFERFCSLIKDIFTKVRFEWLLMGNFSEEIAKYYACDAEQKIRNIRPCSTILPKDQIIQVRTSNLSPINKVFYELQVPTEEQSNCAISMYFQQRSDLETEAQAFNLLCEVIKEKAFQQLRTVEQLGYVVFTLPDDVRGVKGVQFIIQSSVKPSHYLAERISAFLEKEKENIFKLTDEEYDKYKTSLIAKITEKDLSLLDEAVRYWNEIVKHKYIFNRRDVEKEYLEKLNIKDFLNFINELFYVSPKILEVHITNHKLKEENNASRAQRQEKDGKLQQIPSVDWFKRRVPLYPDYYSHL